MKESISTSYFFTAVIIIIGLCSVIIVGGLSYSKAFKIKNRIIEIIEKYDGYFDSSQEEKDEINSLLKETGYPVLDDLSFKCPTGRGPSGGVSGLNDNDVGLKAINTIDSYKYCIYKYKTVKGYYYSIVTYMPIELPLIGDFIKYEIPIYGDTKIFTDL